MNETKRGLDSTSACEKSPSTGHHRRHTRRPSGTSNTQQHRLHSITAPDVGWLDASVHATIPTDHFKGPPASVSRSNPRRMQRTREQRGTGGGARFLSLDPKMRGRAWTTPHTEHNTPLQTTGSNSPQHSAVAFAWIHATISPLRLRAERRIAPTPRWNRSTATASHESG